ncbi:two-component system response regulator [Bacillus sp. M6-12]|uniref:response regulator n=1 Tax=Bacillus sp. M6-12 TaxID=2054166 RepID=UPI000C7625FC|nr:response regulator [Bacillus sp. M6-12]PLS14956.1 two-component system response regulator [Bacillus sp. M6-12]
MDDKYIKVLLIEDDPMVQEVNRQFIERLDNFRIIATASNGEDGIRKIRTLSPDLVILDVFMPLKDGITTLYEIRKEQLDVDVIVVSAANDQHTIRKMIQNGAFDYIIKPFKFERLKKILKKYYLFRTQIAMDALMSQNQLDQVRFQNGNSSVLVEKGVQETLPKGLNEATLKQIYEFLTKQDSALSAEEVADGIGIARVTARRYLDYLKETGTLELDMQYGGIGRPVNKYILKYIR